MSNSLPTKDDFLKNVENHVMTIRQDQGVYRSILFKKPTGPSYWFQITTWDGYLCISGDMGVYVFQRVHDMFKFFRNEEINLGYWSEKCEAGECEKYSPQAAREALNQEFENWKEGYTDEDTDPNFILEEKQHLDEIDTDDYFEFMEAVRNWYPNKNGVQLNDFWEHNLNDYTYHYLWCCHAIVWAISQYDEFKGACHD